MVINLSQTYTLSTTEEKVLEKGLSFIPTAGSELPKQLETEAQVTKLPFTNKSGWEPPPRKIPQKLKDLIQLDKNTVKNFFITDLLTTF
ncbi:uncharacterized protein LOC112845136 [Tachysurus ichikawai]